MCITVMWAVKSSDFTDAFRDLAEELLGVRPEASDYRIHSSRVRTPATTFTATSRICDCDSAIGSKAAEVRPGEIRADQFIAWLQRLPELRIERIALARAWSPELEYTPERQKSVPIGDVDEALLRGVEDEMLLSIYYPEG